MQAKLIKLDLQYQHDKIHIHVEKQQQCFTLITGYTPGRVSLINRVKSCSPARRQTLIWNKPIICIPTKPFFGADARGIPSLSRYLTKFCNECEPLYHYNMNRQAVRKHHNTTSGTGVILTFINQSASLR